MSKFKVIEDGKTVCVADAFVAAWIVSKDKDRTLRLEAVKEAEEAPATQGQGVETTEV